MKKVKKTLKRGFALLCALLCVLPALSGTALASPMPTVATAVPLGSIKDTASAIQAVNAQAQAMIESGVLENAGDARYLSLYAEGALAQSAAEQISGDTLILNAERVNSVGSRLEPDKLEQTLNARLEEQNIEPFGGMGIIAEFQMSAADICVQIEPDIAYVTSVDTVLIKTPFYDLSFSPLDLADDLHETLTIELKDISETLDPHIQVTMKHGENQNVELTGYLTLSLPNASGSLPEMAIVKQVSADEMETIVSSYNRVTEQLEGTVSVPGVYLTPKNGKSFDRFEDAKTLEGSRLTAARFVYGKGIMDGYKDNTFRPFSSVTRGQFVKIMMNSIGYKNTKQAAYYPDVKSGAYYYYPAGIAQKHGYMLGYSDGKFHPEEILNKAQICRIMGRILVQRRKADKNFPPSNTSKVISDKYNDARSIPTDARDYVALLLNLGILSDSGRTFNTKISRIDVVEMLYRAFNKNYL